MNSLLFRQQFSQSWMKPLPGVSIAVVLVPDGRMGSAVDPQIPPSTSGPFGWRHRRVGRRLNRFEHLLQRAAVELAICRGLVRMVQLIRALASRSSISGISGGRTGSSAAPTSAPFVRSRRIWWVVDRSRRNSLSIAKRVSGRIYLMQKYYLPKSNDFAWKSQWPCREQLYERFQQRTFNVSLYSWPPAWLVWIRPNKYNCCWLNKSNAAESKHKTEGQL